MYKIKFFLYFNFEFLLFRLVNFLTFFLKKNIDPTLIIIKNDGIGDYLLIRNFLYELKNSNKFANYKFHAVLNSSCKSLVNYLDPKLFDEIFWVDRESLWKKKLYRLSFFSKFIYYEYSDLIYPSYSREYYLGDTLCRIINAKNKISWYGDLSNTTVFLRNFSSKFYTELYKSKSGNIFEFERNRIFFSKFLNKNILSTPKIKNKNLFRSPYSNKYCVIFIGGGSPIRRWNSENFLLLGLWINNFFNLHCIFLGFKEDIDSSIANKIDGNKFFINLLGKTEMSHLINIVNFSEFIVSNESFVPHLAVSLNKLVFTLMNNAGRFSPYPSNLSSSYISILHPTLTDLFSNNLDIPLKFVVNSPLNINEISLNKVKNSILENYNAKS